MPAANDEPDMPPQAPFEGELVEATEGALLRVGPGSDLDSSLAVALSQAEINQQIATAKTYPRQIQRTLDNITQLATLDAETAAECIYNLPRGKDDNGKAKVITGPSIRLAELIAQQWGNNRVAARIVATDRKEKFVEAEGIYHDLETNSAVSAKVRRRISTKNGHLFSEDMIIVTGNAAASIALRNAILRGVPKPIWRKAYGAVEAVVRGDLQTLAARRVAMMLKFRDNLGIKPDQLFTILQVKGEEDIGLDEMVIATGFYSAIRNNEITIEDLLAQAGPTVVHGKTLSGAFGDKPAAKTTEGGPQTAAEKVGGDHKLKSKNAPQAPAEQAQSGNSAAPDPFDAIDETEEVAHDSETGEVIEGDARPTETGSAPNATAGPASSASATPASGASPAAISSPTPRAEPSPAGEVLKGHAKPGKAYLLNGEGFDANGRRPLYKDGVQFSTVSSIGIGKHQVFQAHAPRIVTTAPEAGADAAAGESLSPPSSDASPTDSPEDREPPTDEEDEPDGEPVDDTPPPTAEQLADRPIEFHVFEVGIEEAKSWKTIREYWSLLRKSEAYKSAPPEVQADAKAFAYNAAIKLHMNGDDSAHPTNDPQLYLLFLTVAQKHEVKPVFQKLIRDPAYKALNDGARDQIAAATNAATGEG